MSVNLLEDKIYKLVFKLAYPMLIGIIAIKSRGIISHIPLKNKKRVEVFQRVSGIFASLLIILIGVSLIITKL